MKMSRLAYITHIENCLNFDIDFPFTDSEIISNRFDLVSNTDYYYTQEDKGMTRGTTYRSRLEGVEISKINNSRTERIKKLASMEFNQIINRSGRFVKYEISGIDVYRRFVVRLFDPISNECLNDIFLQPKYSYVFSKYTPKK